MSQRTLDIMITSLFRSNCTATATLFWRNNVSLEVRDWPQSLTLTQNTSYNKIRLPPRWTSLWNKITIGVIFVELAMEDFVFASPDSGNHLRRRYQRFMTFTFSYKVQFHHIVNSVVAVILDIWEFHICQLFCNPANVYFQNNFRCLYK